MSSLPQSTQIVKYGLRNIFLLVIDVYVTLSVPFFHPSILPPPFPPFIHLSAGLSLCGQDVFLSCSGDLTVKPDASSSSRTGLGQYQCYYSCCLSSYFYRSWSVLTVTNILQLLVLARIAKPNPGTLPPL